MNIYQTKIEDNVNPTYATNHKNTKRYKQIESTEIITFLENNSFTLKETSYATPRKEENQGYQKHIMIFEHKDMGIDEDNSMQLLVTNSHDGKSSIRFNIGIFRTVCANGMVVGSSFFEERLRHVGVNIEKELENVLYKVVATLPTIRKQIQIMQNTKVTANNQLHLSSKVAQYRLKDIDNVKEVDVINMFKPQRFGDCGDDLYTLYNILQEKLLKGGIHYKTKKDDDLVNNISYITKNNTTKKVTNIDKKINYNSWLYDTIIEYGRIG